MGKLQKFLSRDWLLILSPIMYFVGILGMDIIYLQADSKGGILTFGGHLFLASIVLVVCVSYKKHNKNVLIAVLGAALAFVCSNTINDALYYTVNFQNNTKGIVSAILSVLIAISAVIFFINHLILASNHKSNTFMMNFNMITALCFVALSIAWGVFAITCGSSLNSYLYAIFWIFFSIGSVILGINIETKIDYFRKAREEKEVETQEETKE